MNCEPTFQNGHKPGEDGGDSCTVEGAQPELDIDHGDTQQDQQAVERDEEQTCEGVSGGKYIFYIVDDIYTVLIIYNCNCSIWARSLMIG